MPTGRAHTHGPKTPRLGASLPQPSLHTSTHLREEKPGWEKKEQEGEGVG